MDVQLKLVSYNSTGFGPGKPEYVAKLLESHDFVLLQEHWLRESQFHRIKNIPYSDAMVLSHDVSAIDDNVLTVGRGFGGVSIIWKNTLNAVVTPVTTLSNKRVCAAKVCTAAYEFILFNVYMPCDSHDNFNEYVTVWDDIISTCDQNHINNIIIGGDLNTSMARPNSTFTQYLRGFVHKEQFYLSDDSQVSDVNYTYLCPVNNTTHTIDHFIVNDALKHLILSCHSIHDGDNLSSHCPVSMSLNIFFYVVYMSRCNRNFLPRPKWSSAPGDKLTEYRDKLNCELDDIVIPWDVLHCTDPLCYNHTEHCQSIQLFHDSIVDKCLISSESCIPYTSSPGDKSKSVAGWNEIVKPFREASMFWHNIWRDCGSPRNAAISDVMRRARAKYHNVVKQVKTDQGMLKRNNMAQSLLNSEGRSFWTEVRKMTGKGSSVPNMADGGIGNEDIADVFANKYESLYNSVSYDPCDLNILSNTLLERINNDCNDSAQFVIDHNNVNEALRKIKRGKNDGFGILYTDHFINGPNKLVVFLSMLFMWFGWLRAQKFNVVIKL